MAKHAGFWLGFAAAVAVFAITNGLDEYQTARKSRTSVVVNGVERDLTPDELISNFLMKDTLRAIPFGFVIAGLLCFPISIVASKLRTLPIAAALFSAVAVGSMLGGGLSFSAWIVLGGWGPPFLLPSVAAGAVMALLAVASRRQPATRNP